MKEKSGKNQANKLINSHAILMNLRQQNIENVPIIFNQYTMTQLFTTKYHFAIVYRNGKQMTVDIKC